MLLSRRFFAAQATKTFEVAVVGAGITGSLLLLFCRTVSFRFCVGAALFYELAKNSSVQSIAIFEVCLHFLFTLLLLSLALPCCLEICSTGTNELKPWW